MAQVGLFDAAPLPVAAPGVTLDVRQQEATALLRSVEPGSAQVIFADPPYGIAYHSNRYRGDNPHAPIARDWNFQIAPFLSAAAVALADGGAMYLCTRWDVLPLWSMTIAPPVSLGNAIVWVKDSHSAGDLDGNFGFKYEVLMFITKGRHRRRGHRWSNVWEFARVPSKKLRHPAEKPLGLVQRAIEASSDPGHLVIDPFSGSGTTAEAAALCGRSALVGDIDPAMVRLTCERMGLPIPTGLEEAPAPPPCPVFNVAPPSPALWGVHPEDIAHWRATTDEGK